MKLSEIQQQKGFKLLQLAESGHGKSTRALDALRFGKVCVIDIDKKLKELCEANVQKYKDADIDVASVQDAVTKKQRLLKSFAEVQTYINNLKPDNLPFQTLIFDTLSECQDLIEWHHAQLNKKTPLEFSYPDWRAIKELNLSFLRTLLSLPCNVIVNAHLKKDKNVFDQVTLVPGLTGKAGEEVLRLFNEVHFLRYKDNKWNAYGRPQPQSDSVKTLMSSKLDSSGLFVKNDLSIFDEIAFKVKG